jgi:hypothetical protein
MANGWTPERRARQSKLIHNWKPWEKSTGARTPEGKAISSRNAYRYAMREAWRELTRVNRELLNYLNGWAPPPDWELACARREHLFAELERAQIEHHAEVDAVRTKGSLERFKMPELE